MSVNVGQIAVVQAYRDNVDYAELQKLDIPFLVPVVQDLHARQSLPSELTGRAYQRELISKGTFETRSPWTSALVAARQSIILHDKSVYYWFAEDADFLLCAGTLGEGTPINGIFFPSRNLLVNLGHEFWGASATQLQRALELGQRVFAGPGTGSEVIVVTGHPSFAHHIWNQLGALDALATDELCRPLALTILVTHEPLGPLTAMFAERGEWAISYCPEHELEQRNRPGVLWVPLGGARVTRAALARLFGHIRPVENSWLKSSDGPRIWISLRTRNRTPVNQVEFVVNLARTLGERFPGCVIVLDGHSFAEDYGRAAALGDRSHFEFVGADSWIAQEIISRAVGCPGVQFIDAVGLKITRSLALARTCDFYVCHHGTVQHKIGWFTDVPGVAHCNRGMLELHPGGAVASQVEGGVAPHYFPPEFVRDEAAPDPSTMHAALMHDNYEILDLPRACEFVADHVAAALPADAPAPNRNLGQKLLGYFQPKAFSVRIRS